ncbi:zinc finger protein 1-like isoform X2 [Haliotis cracherodii]|uniref:zinc finger protein 1-like isoform X2 n=1 Tax=Haliotis cracherodii TaxID=6455 RepID=UPI0039E9F236
MQLEPCDSFGVGADSSCAVAIGLPEDMFEELKLFPFVENEDHIDDSLATAVEEKMDTPSTGVANGNHDNAVKESQCEVTGVENETSPEPETRKEEAADTHPTQNGTTEEAEEKLDISDKKPVAPQTNNSTSNEADTIKEFLGRSDTVVIFPEPVSDLEEEHATSIDAVNAVEEEYTLKCVHCSENYQRVTLLRDHMKTQHPDKEIKYQCPKCDEVFLLKTQLDKHIALHSPTSQNCKVCNKTFANVYRLQRHMISHDESTDLRKFKCPECGKAFKFKHHLKEHIRIHSGEKPFECPNCGKRFSHSGSYSSHMTSKKCWVMNMKGRRVDRNGNNEGVMYYRSPGQTFNDSLQSPPPGSYPQQFLKYDPRNAGLPSYFSPNLTSSPVRPLGMVAYSLYPDGKPSGHVLPPPKLSPPTIECPKPPPCSTSPVSRAPQISPDVNSNTQLLNLAASEKKVEGPETIKVKQEPDEANKGSRANSPHESAKCETTGEFEHKTNSIGEMMCRFCSTGFKSPVELHQHERYLCKLNKDIVLRMAHLETSRSSPNSTVSDASRHPTPNGSVGDAGTDEEEAEDGKEETNQGDKKYRMRSLISDQQLQFLRAHYQINPRPGKQELIKIANEIGFSKRVVQVWFQNMRARDRRKGKDVPYFPNMARFKAADELPVTTTASAYIPVVPQPFASALSASQSSTPSPKLNGQLTSHSLPPTINKPQTSLSNQDQPLDLTVKRQPPKAHCNSTPSPTPSYSEDQALNLSCKSTIKEEPSKDCKPPTSSPPSSTRLEGSFHQSAIFKYMQQEGLFRSSLLPEIPKTTSSVITNLSGWSVPTIPSKSSSPTASRPSPALREFSEGEQRKSPLQEDQDCCSSDSSSDSSDSQEESDVADNGRLVIDEADERGLDRSCLPSKNDALFHHNLRTLADVSLARMEGELTVADHLGKSKRLRKKSWRQQPCFLWQVEAEEANLDLDDSLNGDDEPLRKKRKSWKNHKMDVDIGMYACDQCDKMFSKQSSLARHKYEHSGARPFCCEVCGKAFKHKHHLTEHKRLHSGEKPFQCKKCGKRFSHSGSFSQHMNHRYKYCKPNDGEED